MKTKMLPRIRFRRRVCRDLIRCFAPNIKLNPSRKLCADAAFVIVTLEVALADARKLK